VHALKTLVRAEGLFRLWRGVPTMFVGCVPAHAAYFSIFEEVSYFRVHLAFHLSGLELKRPIEVA